MDKIPPPKFKGGSIVKIRYNDQSMGAYGGNIWRVITYSEYYQQTVTQPIIPSLLKRFWGFIINKKSPPLVVTHIFRSYWCVLMEGPMRGFTLSLPEEILEHPSELARLIYG